MTLYATSNLVAAIVPAENGGCGSEHRRPVINGAPQYPWGLDCPSCEDFLRKHNSDQWSATISEIPETHDEKLARQDFEKRGAKDKDAVLTLALARIAGIESSQLPDSLTRMISGAPLHVPVPGMLECPQGHAQPAGQRFCGQCGSPMSAPAGKAALSAPERRPEPLPEVPSPPGPQRLRDARLETLQALAHSRGLDEGGTRGDLISRLAAAGVTNADLRRMPAAV